MLGDHLAAIAVEKAGIIKTAIPVVIGERHPETDEVFIQKALETNSPLVFAEDELQLSPTRQQQQYLVTTVKHGQEVIFEDLALDLTGIYQLKNVLTVAAAILKLRELDFDIPDAAVYAALHNVKEITGLQGRWQTLSTSPLTICDTGHNVAGITEVIKNIQNTPLQKAAHDFWRIKG